MIGIVIASFMCIFGFVGLSIFRFGLLKSYSAYASRWSEYRLLPTNLHLWSIVTIVSAMLLLPAMIGLGDGNDLQFLGFFAPLYLMIVGLTPEYETNPKQRKIHTIGAVICALFAIIWIAFVAKYWAVFLACSFVMLVFALATNTHICSKVFWCEMAAFLSTYITLFMSYV